MAEKTYSVASECRMILMVLAAILALAEIWINLVLAGVTGGQIVWLPFLGYLALFGIGPVLLGLSAFKMPKKPKLWVPLLIISSLSILIEAALAVYDITFPTPDNGVVRSSPVIFDVLMIAFVLILLFAAIGLIIGVSPHRTARGQYP